MAEWLCSGLQLRVHRFDSVLSLHIMKFLITGSSGFIGYHLTKRLLNDGHEVIGIDNNNDFYSPALKESRKKKLKAKNFKFYKCDINNIRIDDNDIDLAINLAAQPGVRIQESKEYLYDYSNVKGFESFCDFCNKNSISKIIYASSSSVYSDIGIGKFSESKTKLNPKSKYGQSKLLNEMHAEKITKNNNLSAIGLRFFSVYGPFGRPDMAYYSFTDSLKRGKRILLNNSGNMYRDMTYVDDIIDGICASIEYIKDFSGHEIFNLGNDKPIRTNFLLQTLEEKLNKKGKVKFVNTINEAKKTHADIEKAKNLLGYMPKVSFLEGIEYFLEWHDSYEN